MNKLFFTAFAFIMFIPQSAFTFEGECTFINPSKPPLPSCPSASGSESRESSCTETDGTVCKWTETRSQFTVSGYRHELGLQGTDSNFHPDVQVDKVKKLLGRMCDLSDSETEATFKDFIDNANDPARTEFYGVMPERFWPLNREGRGKETYTILRLGEKNYNNPRSENASNPDIDRVYFFPQVFTPEYNAIKTAVSSGGISFTEMTTKLDELLQKRCMELTFDNRSIAKKILAYTNAYEYLPDNSSSSIVSDSFKPGTEEYENKVGRFLPNLSKGITENVFLSAKKCAWSMFSGTAKVDDLLPNLYRRYGAWLSRKASRVGLVDGSNLFRCEAGSEMSYAPPAPGYNTKRSYFPLLEPIVVGNIKVNVFGRTFSEPTTTKYKCLAYKVEKIKMKRHNFAYQVVGGCGTAWTSWSGDSSSCGCAGGSSSSSSSSSSAGSSGSSSGSSSGAGSGSGGSATVIEEPEPAATIDTGGMLESIGIQNTQF